MTNGQPYQPTICAPIYAELAAQQIVDGVRMFTGMIDKAIQYIVSMTSRETALRILDEQPNHTHEFGNLAVRTDPTKLDGHDILLMLYELPHHVPDEVDRQEIQRLILQTASVGKLSQADMETIKRLLSRYIPAVSVEIANTHRIKAWEIQEMLNQRLENGSLCASSRVDGLCDPHFDRALYTEITLRGDEILVRCGDPAVDAIFGAYQRSLYGNTDAGLLDLVSMEPRMINGVLTAYDAQRFHAATSVAWALTEIADRLPRSMVALEVRLLALRNDFGYDLDYTPTEPAAPAMNGR